MMDLTYITEFISPITLVICLIVGYIIKYVSRSNTLTQLIPLIVAVLGILLCVWETGAFTPLVVAMGLVSGLGSTGLYEALRNILSLADGGDGTDDEDLALRSEGKHAE